MAIVGDAYVMIHAITSGIDKDIKDGFKNVDKQGGDAGEKVGRSYQRGLRRGSRGGGIDFKKFIKESEAAKEKFSGLTRTGYTLAPLFQAAAGTIGVLGTSLISLGSIIGAITLPAIAVLGSSMMSLAQAAVTVKLAFAGVGKAISAGNKASKAGAGNAKALKKATEALRRAQQALSDVYEDAAKAVKKADKELLETMEELHKAREQAIEDLQQLGFDSEDAAIAEQRAAIELEKARETLARVSDLPPNSRARKEAELAFAEADLNYRRAIDKNNDLKKTEAKNALLGDTVEKQVEGQENVVKALKEVADAKENIGIVELQNSRAIRSATEGRNDAQDALDDIKNNTDAVDAYQDALKDLSPAARDFVKYIVSLKDVFKELKAAAGKDLFPKLTVALKNLFATDNIKIFKDLLQGTGSALGDIAINFSKTITTGDNLKRLQSVWKTNDDLLRKFGEAGANLYEVFLIILETAKPLIDAFGDWLVKLTAGWKMTLNTTAGVEKLSGRFKIAQGIFKDLGKIFGNVFGGLGKLFDANTGPGSGGQIFLDYFKDITEKFKNLKEIDGKPLKEFFAGAAKNGTKLLDLLGKIFGGFIKLADDPALGIFYDNIGKAVDILGTIDLGPAMIAISEFGIEFAKFIALVTESGSIETFFGVLTTALEKLNKFLASDLGQNILKTSAKILPFLAAFGLIAKIGGFALKVIVGGFMAIIKPIAAVSGAISGIAAFFGVTVGAVLLVVAAIAVVVAILVLAYQKSEVFREAIDKMVKILKTAVIDNFIAIKKTIADAFGSGSASGFMDTMKSIGDFIGRYLVPIFTTGLKFAIDMVGGAIRGLIYAFAAVRDGFTAVYKFFQGIFRLFRGDFSGAAQAFRDAFSSAFKYIVNLFKGVVSILSAPINLLIDGINGALSNFSFTVPKWIPGIGGNKFTFPKIPKIPLSFAEGGTVFPQTGGVLARVAEAGRAERIEPLDAQGLSVRDRAIIAELSGGKGTTINMVINPSADMDERELAAIVSRQIAFQLRRGAA